MASEKLNTIVAEMKKKGPLVQCLTNFVSMDIMANGLLAAGASPAMVHSPDELDDAIKIVKAIGGAVSINIGTLDASWIDSFKRAVNACQSNGVPWVLDPVAAGFTPLRTDTAISLLELGGCAVVRGNGSEINALAGAVGGGKGVDSTESSNAAIDSAKALASKYKCVVCVSGQVDYICDPNGAILECHNGVEMLTKITAAGCLVSSLIAAFLVSKPEEYSNAEAAQYAFMFFGQCAERAAKESKGPGSLKMNLMDQMYNWNE